MLKWFCRLCLRGGSIELIPLGQESVIAAREHRLQVQAALDPQNVPGAGMTPNSPIMEKYPGVHCPGDIVLGEAVSSRRKRRSSENETEFTFPEEL